MNIARRFPVIAFISVSFWLLLVFPLRGRAAAQFLGPSPYLSVTNSPFNTNGFTYFHRETFEDGVLNTPGVMTNNGWLVTGSDSRVDSVDADDGFIDGSGTNGRSLYSTVTQSNLILTFNASALGGNLPTHVGIVCTDIGAVLSGQFGIGDVTLTARDADGALLGSVVATNFGNGSAQGASDGATAEDRFMGVTNAAGISSISVSVSNSVDWEVDHLQYGYYVPTNSVPTNSAPQLRIQLSAPDTVSVAWSTNAVGFSLQENSVITSTNWNAVTNVPAVVGNEFRVTVTPLSSNRFYRLIAP